MTVSLAFAQKSILRNGGFEEHGKQQCLSCYQSSGQYGAIVYHWDNGGWHCMLCNKDYKQHPDDIKGRVCPMDRISPQSGKAMISMVYATGMNGIFGGVEGASHLSARTTEPMRVGRLYEVCLWLYVETAKRHDPDWGSHLGIALLPQKLSFFNGRNPLIIPFISIDTLMYDQWYQVKWRVRPLCTSNYLMVGVFADPQWPRSRSYADVRYFLDNVSVVEMPEASAVSDSSVQKWLPVLQQACEVGELPWIMYAKCYDQSMLGQGKPQRYLTDYAVLDDGSAVLPPWEGDEETVNDFRAKIGLPLLPKNVCDAMKKER